MKMNIVRLGMGVSALYLLFMCLCPVPVLALDNPVDTLGDNSSVTISVTFNPPVAGYIETSFSTSASECMTCLEESAWKKGVTTFDECFKKSYCQDTKVRLDFRTKNAIFLPYSLI